jgi:hypothetical protein
MAELKELMALLERGCSGQDLTEQQLEAVHWHCADPTVAKVATLASLDLRRFVDDADLRARDLEYERSLRKVLCLWHSELTALLRGEDPQRRRASWWRRALWHFWRN